MKKKILIFSLILFSAVTAIYLKDKNENNLSYLLLDNIEALANAEGDDGDGKDCKGGCSAIGWGSEQIVRCNCSETWYLSSCNRWGC